MSNEEKNQNLILQTVKIPQLKNIRKIIFKKYLPIKTLAKSRYSAVFLAKCVKDNKYVAIKMQGKDSKISELQKEAFYLYALKGFGIPKILSFGIFGRYKVLVESLLGKTIETLLKSNKNKISRMKDICMISIQIIERIEYIHNKNIIHQDIKPANFLVGNPDDSVIYVIDYGMSKKYRSSIKGNHILFSKKKKFRGTFNFSSINSMKLYEESRRDDLESIGYMIIYLITGKLPWSKVSNPSMIDRYKNVLNLKQNISNQELCKGLPSEIFQYMEYVKYLKFEEKPDYSYLKNLFLSILHNMNMTNDLLFSWRKIKVKSVKNETVHYFNLMASENGIKKKSPFNNIIHDLTKSVEHIKDYKDYENDINIKTYNKVKFFPSAP